MTSTPLSPAIVSNIEFVENYIDCVENLPLDIQRFVSQLREYDVLYKTKLEQIGELLCSYRTETSSVDKRKLLTKMQKCLIKSQQYGDEKLQIISQIVDLVEARAQQVANDAHSVDMDYKEEITKNINNNHRMKLEKPPKPNNTTEKTTKNIYEKPKRIRRVRVTDKTQEKGEKNNKDNTEENEDEEMEEEDDVEPTKPKKDTKKTKEKEKVVKEKAKEEKEEKKEEKKLEKNQKMSGKVTKKTSIKQITKIKKKKRKEKEVSIEDIPVDPNEPVYCVCNSISYGDMIGCDNEDCQIEWFHFGCVNLTNKPKGKWFCPPCTLQRKEKYKK